MGSSLRTRLWGLGVRLLHILKRFPPLDSFEPLILRSGPALVSPLSEESVLEVPRHMRMMVPPGSPSARTLSLELYEPEVTELMPKLVLEGMNVVDVGANFGYYTLIASRLVGDTGEVYAFEPDPQNYRYLRRNLEINGCSNVVIERKAVAHERSMAPFVRDRGGAEGHLTGVSTEGEVIEVPTVSLDEYFSQKGWPPIHFIKMDVEGGEEAALEGMPEVSRKNPHLRMVMEFNIHALHRSGTTRVELGTTLIELGFRHGYIIERALRPFAIEEGLPRSRATYNLLLTKVGKLLL